MGQLDKDLMFMSPETFLIYGNELYQFRGKFLMPVVDVWLEPWIGNMCLNGRDAGSVPLPEPPKPPKKKYLRTV